MEKETLLLRKKRINVARRYFWCFWNASGKIVKVGSTSFFVTRKMAIEMAEAFGIEYTEGKE